MLGPVNHFPRWDRPNRLAGLCACWSAAPHRTANTDPNAGSAIGEKIGVDLSRGSFSLPPDHELVVSWMEEFRQWRRKSQEHFDPLHMKEPRPPNAKQRKAIEIMSYDAR